MKKSDDKAFAELLQATLEIYGQKPSPNVVLIWIAALENYALDDVRKALSEYVKKAGAGHFAPRPADVIEVLQGKDGFLSADEAWAMLPMTEAETAVWTDEMSQSWGIALGLIESGDLTAARMAFRSAYERLVVEARRAGKRPAWSVTLGHDRHGRETALTSAVLRGYLTASRAAQLVEPDVARRLLALKLPGTALQ